MNVLIQSLMACGTSSLGRVRSELRSWRLRTGSWSLRTPGEFTLVPRSSNATDFSSSPHSSHSGGCNLVFAGLAISPKRPPASSSCTILPFPRTGPSSRCKLQLMTKTRLSRCSRPPSDIAPSDSGSSISPSPMKAQTLRGLVSARPRIEILEEARLIDRHQRPEAHRHGRKLPEIRHQPGMRIGRHPLAVDLLAEIEKLLLA